MYFVVLVAVPRVADEMDFICVTADIRTPDANLEIVLKKGVSPVEIEPIGRSTDIVAQKYACPPGARDSGTPSEALGGSTIAVNAIQVVDALTQAVVRPVVSNRCANRVTINLCQEH